MARARTMSAWYKFRQTDVSNLRRELVGDGTDRHGGLSGKFKTAARASLHYWKRTFAPLHFNTAAYPRYNYPVPKYHSEHRVSKLGRSMTVRGQTLTPPYSYKQYKQARNHIPVSKPDLPLVFSGNTRRGILQGPFRTYGASARIIKGSWGGGGICWAWLAKAHIMGCGVNDISAQEAEYMVSRIRSCFQRLLPLRSADVPRDDGSLSTLVT
jgi:hypothetical protein